MDFYTIMEHEQKDGSIDIYPNFVVKRSKDLMVRGKSFYAIWDEEAGLWSTDEYDVQRLVDRELYEYRDQKLAAFPELKGKLHLKTMSSFSSNMWVTFRRYLQNVSDCSIQLDEKLTFQNTVVKKTDYVSKRLPYSLEDGECPAYEELMSTLYDESEREKLEWAIGAVVAGEAKDIQKFLVLYGEAGAGKSTVLNIIQQLFAGYYTSFEAKSLVSNNNSFAMEVFKTNPLVAIQHDGDLSRIEDNSKLNSIISHEEMTMNEKYKPSYTSKVNGFLFLATNKPVKITDAKSGIIRRLIDVSPSGRKVPVKRYFELVSQIGFETGKIATHTLKVYKDLGKNYYSTYKPIDMMFQTDVFYNFVESCWYEFKEADSIGLQQAYDMYKAYCEDSLVEFRLPRYRFREELKNYFADFKSEAHRYGDRVVRNMYHGFDALKFVRYDSVTEEKSGLVLDSYESIFDSMCKDCRAQYPSDKGTPKQKWEKVKTSLADLDTTKLHYVQVPTNHIVIDFDLKDSEGNKSADLNLEAASKWPPTYAEYSKSGGGIHLHYIYSGDPTKLSSSFSDGIEVKTLLEGASLRRQLSKCNNLPVAIISTGLPLKGDKMVNADAVKSERSLRSLIVRNLNKEIHPGTKPSIDFIYKILEDAYSTGLKFDLTDMRPAILAFAVSSSNQSDYCVKMVSKMKFASDEPSEAMVPKMAPTTLEDILEEIVFFDVEVFPNLFVVVWKQNGKQKVRMINPPPSAMEPLLERMLVGFNCRRYDNHILYARYIGYTNEQLYQLSQRIIGGSRNAMFGEAYNLSYTDIYDFSSKKQSLKKFEIDLGIHHMELGLPWDQPVPEELWNKVALYCENDVDATEATFYARLADFKARLILAKLSGLTANDTTRTHAGKIIFGNDKKPQEKFVYTDLSGEFPGYKYEFGKSTYRDEETGEGGYVYAEPGMYGNVALLDVASMHPTTINHLNVFGPYTKKFKEILDARLDVKHGDFEHAKGLLDGSLAEFLEDASDAEDLAYALKRVINMVYGFTSAKFENLFKDPRNKDNIVAKRGALFMIDLKHAVQEQGFTVAHIKTDSIKIPDATPEIIEFVFEFGKKYGYTFEHEATYDRMCLLNDAVYVARYPDGNWTATGAQFIHPYVFKTLFSKEEVTFEDLCETKTVNSSLYLDMNENLSDGDHNYEFVGKIGMFLPMKPGAGGGLLMREKDGKYYAATGSKGYRWMEAEMVKTLEKQNDIDTSYHQALAEATIKDLNSHGDFEWFVDPKPYDRNNNGILPF